MIDSIALFAPGSMHLAECWHGNCVHLLVMEEEGTTDKRQCYLIRSDKGLVKIGHITLLGCISALGSEIIYGD